MTLRGRIVEALTGVTNPRTGHTVIEEAAVRDLALTDSGKVRLTFLLGAQDPASLVRDVRQTVERVDGVTEVRVDVKDPSQVQRPAPHAAPAPAANPRALPVMEPPRAAPGPQRPAPPLPLEIAMMRPRFG
jgi:ATP-binding protein involved in chromosome partitioning